MFLFDIFKVIYSPVKAFREIQGNPRYFGPVIIIIISLLLSVGTQYVSVSKHYVETITPTSRVYWTNTTSPASLWTSNALPANITAASNNNSDLLAGNYSVRAAVINTTEVWLRTNTNGTVNCSSNSGFRTFYYKLMYSGVNQTQTPQNVSYAVLRMFSHNNESRYFEFNLLSQGYLNKSQAWIDTNVTLSEWNEINVSETDWSNITGFEFRLGFPENGSLSLYLNDLYFGGKYEALFDAFGFSNWLSATIVGAAFDIFLRWLIFAALLWLTIKVFHPEGSTFRTLLIIVGYAFAIMFVYVPVDILSVSQLPLLYFPNRVILPLTGREIQNAGTLTANIYSTYWTPTIPYNVFIGIWYLSHVWTIGLFTVALKNLPNLSWKRALLISAIAYVMGLFVRAIIPI